MLDGESKAWGLSGMDISVDLFVLDKTNQLSSSVINLRCRKNQISPYKFSAFDRF